MFERVDAGKGSEEEMKVAKVKRLRKAWKKRGEWCVVVPCSTRSAWRMPGSRCVEVCMWPALWLFTPHTPHSQCRRTLQPHCSRLATLGKRASGLRYIPLA
jgi:hypothetical protein